MPTAQVGPATCGPTGTTLPTRYPHLSASSAAPVVQVVSRSRFQGVRQALETEMGKWTVGAWVLSTRLP